MALGLRDETANHSAESTPLASTAPIRFSNDQHPTDSGGSLIKRLWLPNLISFDSRTVPDEAGAVRRFAYIQTHAHRA